MAKTPKPQPQSVIQTYLNEVRQDLAAFNRAEGKTKTHDPDVAHKGQGRAAGVVGASPPTGTLASDPAEAKTKVHDPDVANKGQARVYPFGQVVR